MLILPLFSSFSRFIFVLFSTPFFFSRSIRGSSFFILFFWFIHPCQRLWLLHPYLKRANFAKSRLVVLRIRRTRTATTRYLKKAGLSSSSM
ncbi:hypothetical protein BX666DRAFT_1908543 [Dichotomocladium elegans]|nr:hypothetical protein BX666DRAFT_1908543 [Dichotomocladium elegans]